MSRTNIHEINKQSSNFFFTCDALEDKSTGLPSLSGDAIINVLKSHDEIENYVFQLERGKESTDKNPNGYLHYQGCFFLFRNKLRRIKDVNKWFSDCNISIAIQIVKKSDIAASRYCSKNDTRIAGPWWSSEDFEKQMNVKPTASQQGVRNDLQKLKDALDEGMTPDEIVLDSELSLLMNTTGSAYVDRYFNALMKQKSQSIRDVTVNYLYGRSDVGKSYYVQNILHKPSEVFKTRLTKSHPFDSYNNQPVLLLEEFRSEIKDVGDLYDMLDHYQFEMESRYRNKFAIWNEVWIATNWELKQQYKKLTTYNAREPFYRRINNVYVKLGKYQAPFRLGSGRDCLNNEFYHTPLNEITDDYFDDESFTTLDEPLPDEMF